MPITKKNDQLRIYVDFWDLNKAYLKRCIFSPIAWPFVRQCHRTSNILIHGWLSGYNQIYMAPEDEEK